MTKHCDQSEEDNLFGVLSPGILENTSRRTGSSTTATRLQYYPGYFRHRYLYTNSPSSSRSIEYPSTVLVNSYFQMSLNEIWEASSAPYYPLVSKDNQFFVGFSLLLTGMAHLRYICFLDNLDTKLTTLTPALILTGLFGLSECSQPSFVSLTNFTANKW